MRNRSCPLSLPYGWLAEPKLQSREGWRPGLDLNQDTERCTALAWEAFRHRAAAIITDRARVSHVYPLLTLTGPILTGSILTGLGPVEGVPRHKRHPPRIVPDIDVGARGGEAGGGALLDHLAFAVALQADPRAQLPVVGQGRAGQAVKRVFQEAVGGREFH